ncbi:MAG: hypothetical protein OXL96_05325 [Candidatus Poribacteria bacterium]|nr:hypothetical protein [Candidatus Poribacteria bacterium]
MYINCKLLLSVVFLLSLVFPVFCFEPSGGVLVLDGEDDYAILSLAEHGYIFPRNTDAFTVEVWFYPKSRPEPTEAHIILSQQIVFGLTGSEDRCRGRLGKKDQVCSYGLAYLEGVARGITGIDAVIKTDQWNYLAVIFTDSTLYLAYNDQIVNSGKFEIMSVVAGDLRIPEAVRDFFVGGYIEDWLIMKDEQVLSRKTYFHGAIDAIRFSNIARYDLPAEEGFSPFEPPHRFESDVHTLAFWDFNDEEGSDHFQDESGNGKTLIGMNGAITLGGTGVNLEGAPEDGLQIRPNTSLATTWGQVKSESF